MARGNGAAPGDGDLQAAFPWLPDSRKRRSLRGKDRIRTLSEIDIHTSVAQFLDWCLAPPSFYTTFPSGWDKMSKSRAGKLYACGLKAGMPDILVFSRGVTIGLELKTTKGRLSIVQKFTFDRLSKAGVPVYLCRSVDQVEETLRSLHIPLNGTVKAA